MSRHECTLSTEMGIVCFVPYRGQSPEVNAITGRCYVLNSKMDRQGTWGSDVEILVAAHLLKSAIFVYTKCGDSWQWVQHDLDLTSPKSRLSKESVYLVHTDLTHYNVVTDIRCLLGQGESGTSVKTSNIVQGVNDKEYFAIVKILDSFYRNRKDRSRYRTKEKILRQALMNRKKNKRYPAKNYNYQKCGLKMCSTATQRNLTRSTGKCKKTHYGRKKYHLKPRKYYRMDRSTHRWQSKGCLSKRYPPRLPDYARQRVRRRAERSRFCGR
ncbi:uncharacterized protein LOC101862805 isoform X2 [Aplysia californica]|uniref:Uncharacterized protein LOC101862805 isoform X2 n=1 Tax=Aplysia californica TaxID=6500 RepID=A0ABM0JT57_APLCA|nr:uncharacterized protein LOC101862805 isoform X2 [Aplysia californica]